MNTLAFVNSMPELAARVLAAVVNADREVRRATNTGARTPAHDAMERDAAALAAAWKAAQDKAADAFLSAFRTRRIAADAWRYGSAAENEPALAAVGLREGFDLLGQPGVDETWRYRGIVGRTVRGFTPAAAAIVADLLGADFAFNDARQAVLRLLTPAAGSPAPAPARSTPAGGAAAVGPAPAGPFVPPPQAAGGVVPRPAGGGGGGPSGASLLALAALAAVVLTR